MTSSAVQTINLVLQRSNSLTPWGFRLQGGTDYPIALSIQTVTASSLAETSGLQAGDAILRINDRPADELTHEEAKQEIIRSADRVEFLLQRANVVTWKPTTVTVQTPNGSLEQKTSLSANKQTTSHIGSQFNRTARPFPGSAVNGNGAKTSAPSAAPYNNPSGLYSNTTVDDAYSAQADALSRLAVNDPSNTQHRLSPIPSQMRKLSANDGKEQRSVSPSLLAMVQKSDSGKSVSPTPTNNPMPSSLANNDSNTSLKDEKSSAIFADIPDGEEIRYKGYTDPAKQSRSFRLLEQGLNNGSPVASSVIRSVKSPSTTASPSEQKTSPTCQVCGALIIGMAVRVKGDTMHPDCFKCSSCGISLRNQGYFTVEGKIYCETHAIAAVKPPSADVVVTPIYR